MWMQLRRSRWRRGDDEADGEKQIDVEDKQRELEEKRKEEDEKKIRWDDGEV